MKTNLSTLIVAAALSLCGATFGTVALAEECTVLGPLTNFELAPDGKSAKAVVKDSKTKEDTTLTITDELTLNRYRQKPIKPGSEIRAHFEKDGNNTCHLFEKAVGGHDRGVGTEYFFTKTKK